MFASRRGAPMAARKARTDAATSVSSVVSLNSVRNTGEADAASAASRSSTTCIRVAGGVLCTPELRLNMLLIFCIINK